MGTEPTDQFDPGMPALPDAEPQSEKTMSNVTVAPNRQTQQPASVEPELANADADYGDPSALF